MGTKKWSLAVAAKLFIFTLATVPLTLLLFQSLPPNYGDLKNIILSLFGRKGPSTDKVVPKKWALSPNLSSCHKSTGGLNTPVYCCPTKPESDDQAIDFHFPNPSLPQRIRKPTHLLDDNYIAKYKKALTIMKSLPLDDPRSFKRQAKVHCLYCTGAYDQKNSNVPLDIHNSWLFFPWHRMFIHFHERILGHLINDDTFALPFWAWDIPNSMTIPKMYFTPPFMNNKRDTLHYPPKIVDLHYFWAENGLSSQKQMEANMALLYTQVVSGAKKQQLFMGCPLKAGEEGSCVGSGTMEFAPHDLLHSWVGSGKEPLRQDMGVFYAAARDPIFYAHHGNIDRIWEVWRSMPSNNDINDSDWLDSYFYFYDEKPQLVKIKVRDVLNITNLGYSYQPVEIPWLNKKPKPSVSPKTSRQKLHMRNHSTGEMQRNVIKLDERSITMVVPRPKRPQKGEEEVLFVYGIDVKEDIDVMFDVYVNLVDESLASPTIREFAGSFVRMRSGVEAMKKRKMNMRMGISELLSDLEADEDERIWVTLLPKSTSSSSIRIDGIRIEHMQ